MFYLTGLQKRIVNFSIFPKLAPFLATTVHCTCTCWWHAMLLLKCKREKKINGLFFSERSKYTISYHAQHEWPLPPSDFFLWIKSTLLHYRAVYLKPNYTSIKIRIRVSCKTFLTTLLHTTTELLSTFPPLWTKNRTLKSRTESGTKTTTYIPASSRA